MGSRVVLTDSDWTGVLQICWRSHVWPTNSQVLSVTTTSSTGCCLATLPLTQVYTDSVNQSVNQSISWLFVTWS